MTKYRSTHICFSLSQKWDQSNCQKDTNVIVLLINARDVTVLCFSSHQKNKKPMRRIRVSNEFSSDSICYLLLCYAGQHILSDVTFLCVYRSIEVCMKFEKNIYMHLYLFDEFHSSLRKKKFEATKMKEFVFTKTQVYSRKCSKIYWKKFLCKYFLFEKISNCNLISANFEDFSFLYIFIFYNSNNNKTTTKNERKKCFCFLRFTQ